MEFMDYQKQTHSKNTPAAYQLPVRVLKEVLGAETQLASITRQDVEKACALMKQVPLNMTQRYRGLSVEKAIESADRLRDERRLKPRTLKNYYILISAVFNYACDEGYIKENPAKSRKLRGMFKEERKSTKRALFTDEELQAIFSAPLYSGCVNDESGFNKPGSNHPKRGRFWVPLLALFHGLRCNEACQLYGLGSGGYLSDIRFLSCRPCKPLETPFDFVQILLG
jgi:integrase